MLLKSGPVLKRPACNSTKLSLVLETSLLEGVKFVKREQLFLVQVTGGFKVGLRSFGGD